MAPAYLAVAVTLFVTATGLTSPMLRLSAGSWLCDGGGKPCSFLGLPCSSCPFQPGDTRWVRGRFTLPTQTAWKCMRREIGQPRSRAQLWYPQLQLRAKGRVSKEEETTLRSSYQAVLKDALPPGCAHERDAFQ